MKMDCIFLMRKIGNTKKAKYHDKHQNKFSLQNHMSMFYKFFTGNNKTKLMDETFKYHKQQYASN